MPSELHSQAGIQRRQRPRPCSALSCGQEVVFWQTFDLQELKLIPLGQYPLTHSQVGPVSRHPFEHLVVAKVHHAFDCRLSQEVFQSATVATATVILWLWVQS